MHAFDKEFCFDNGRAISRHESHWKAVEAMLASDMTRDEREIVTRYGTNQCGFNYVVVKCDDGGELTYFEPAWHKQVMDDMKGTRLYQDWCKLGGAR
ncbi:MAG: hypothetical protein WC100_03485 [Sterolibacterium sp.]